MNEPKESDKLAEKLTVKGTFEISAKSVSEFDSLMIEIKKKQEQFVCFSLDVTCKWEYGFYEGSDSRILKVKSVPDDGWDKLVNHIRDIETQVITYLNKDKPADEEGIVPVFSCNAKLKIEYKDKEAQKALEDDKQLVMFAPIDLIKKQYDEKFDLIVKDMKPDGANVGTINFTHVSPDGSVREAELKG